MGQMARRLGRPKLLAGHDWEPSLASRGISYDGADVPICYVTTGHRAACRPGHVIFTAAVLACVCDSTAQVCTDLPEVASDESEAVVVTPIPRLCTDVPGQGSYETRLHAC